MGNSRKIWIKIQSKIHNINNRFKKLANYDTYLFNNLVKISFHKDDTSGYHINDRGVCYLKTPWRYRPWRCQHDHPTTSHSSIQWQEQGIKRHSCINGSMAYQQSPLWAAYCAFMGHLFIALHKCLDVGPIGV